MLELRTSSTNHTQGKPSMSEEDVALFEAAVNNLIAVFDVGTPPIPIELMLQRPKAGMWKEVNLSELSAAFISVKHRYSPRMSIARLLARHICRSEWGIQHQLVAFADNDDAIRAFARALVMPRALIDALSPANRMPLTISTRFEVPEDDVLLRLSELGYPPSEA